MMKTARVSSIVAVAAILLLVTSFSQAQTIKWVYEECQNLVFVTLGTGLPGIEDSFTPVAGPVQQVITNQMAPPYCGEKYSFYFGEIPEIVLVEESLIVRIEYREEELGDGHIYWSSRCCPSALRIECPSSPVLEGTWSTVKAL